MTLSKQQLIEELKTDRKSLDKVMAKLGIDVTADTLNDETANRIREHFRALQLAVAKIEEKNALAAASSGVVQTQGKAKLVAQEAMKLASEANLNLDSTAINALAKMKIKFAELDASFIINAYWAVFNKKSAQLNQEKVRDLIEQQVENLQGRVDLYNQLLDSNLSGVSDFADAATSILLEDHDLSEQEGLKDFLSGDVPLQTVLTNQIQVELKKLSVLDIENLADLTVSAFSH